MRQLLRIFCTVLSEKTKPNQLKQLLSYDCLFSKQRKFTVAHLAHHFDVSFTNRNIPFLRCNFFVWKKGIGECESHVAMTFVCKSERGKRLIIWRDFVRIWIGYELAVDSVEFCGLCGLFLFIFAFFWIFVCFSWLCKVVCMLVQILGSLAMFKNERFFEVQYLLDVRHVILCNRNVALTSMCNLCIQKCNIASCLT